MPGRGVPCRGHIMHKVQDATQAEACWPSDSEHCWPYGPTPPVHGMSCCVKVPCRDRRVDVPLQRLVRMACNRVGVGEECAEQREHVESIECYRVCCTLAMLCNNA